MHIIGLMTEAKRACVRFFPSRADSYLVTTLAEPSQHLAVEWAFFFAGKANFDSAAHVRPLLERGSAQQQLSRLL